MSAKNSTVETELQSMGASHPSLWIALFDVTQAIHGSKPLPEMPEWNSVCSTVQDLYRLALKDPREFAVAQTLTTIMHQHQVKEEILNRVSAVQCPDIKDPEECAQTDVAEQLAEIEKQLETLSGAAKELGKAVEDFKNQIESSPKDLSDLSAESFIIPLWAFEKINKFISDYYLKDDYSRFSRELGLHPEWTSQAFEKARALQSSEVSAEAILMLYLILTSGQLLLNHECSEIARAAKVIRTAYKDTCKLPRSNVYQDIERSLVASFIVKRDP